MFWIIISIRARFWIPSVLIQLCYDNVTIMLRYSLGEIGGKGSNNFGDMQMKFGQFLGGMGLFTKIITEMAKIVLLTCNCRGWGF